jgi:hypothetical protein
VDAKAHFEEEPFRKLIPDIDVHIVHPRIKVYWGHDSELHATLALLRLAFHTSGDTDRFILISGQDLPIKTNEHIRQFFDNNSYEYLQYYKFPVEWWVYGGYDRVQVYSFTNVFGQFWNKVNREIQMLLPFRRQLPFDGPLFGGGQWFNLTRGAIEYVLQYVQNTDILKKIKYTSCIDELFFQSVLLNSPFADQCKCADMRYAEWVKSQTNPIASISHPKTLDQADFPKLQESKHLFARKIDVAHDAEIVHSVVQLLGKAEFLDGIFGNSVD